MFESIFDDFSIKMGKWVNILDYISIVNNLLISMGVGFFSLLILTIFWLQPGYNLNASRKTGINVISPLILFSPEKRLINILHTPLRKT